MKTSQTLEKAKGKMAEQLTIDPARPILEQRKPGIIRSILQKFYPSEPETNASSQALETFHFQELNFHTEEGKKMIYTIIRRNALMFKSVKTKAAIAIPSIDFKFNNKREQKTVEIFLKNLHPASGKLQLTAMLRDLYMDVDSFGTGFFDPIWNKGMTMIEGLKRTHPIEMDLIRDDGFGSGGEVKLDKKGNPVGWEQKVGQKIKQIPFANIAYLTFNTIGDEWLGISNLEPIYQTVWRLMNIEEGIATAIFRHGFPLYDIKVSGAQEGRPPTKEQLDEAAKEVAGLNYKSEFVHGPNYSVKLLESFSIGKSSEYVEPFVDQIVAMSDLPKFILMGSTDSTGKASAPELVAAIKPLLAPSKEKLKLFFEEQILFPLMKANNIDTVPQLIINDAIISPEQAEENKKKSEEQKEEEGEEEERKKKASEKLREKEELAKKNAAAEKETEKINENKKTLKAQAKHKFRAAEWTHSNGHPRCLICGDEEREGGYCEGLEKEKKSLEEHTNKKDTQKQLGELPALQITPNHASMFLQDAKKQIVKSKEESKKIKKLLGKEIYLVSRDKAIAIIKLRDAKEIDSNEFVQLEYAHRMSQTEKEELYGHDEEEFVVYEFDKIELFNKPKSFKGKVTNNLLASKITIE